MIVDIGDVLDLPVSVVDFVLKNKHGHGTVPIIPRAPGNVESGRASEDVEIYNYWW